MQKNIVEETPFIDIDTIKRLQQQEEGKKFAARFPFSNKIMMEIENRQGYIIINFTDRKDFPQYIELEKGPVGFGVRTWIACPLCGGLCEKLYCTNLSFKCRKCADLVYRSSKLTGNVLDATDWKIRKLQHRLGMNTSAEFGTSDYVDIQDLPQYRPKHMKQATYDRLRLELVELITKRIEAWLKQL